MTTTERRQHQRYNPAGLYAVIKVGKGNDPFVFSGEVIDISLDGVKLKLDKLTPDDLEGDIEIDLFLPKAEIPITVNGILKYINDSGEMGLHYLNCPAAEVLNHFMFECMKLSESKH